MITRKTNADPHERAIPIMPCHDIKTLVAFYEVLGFEVLQVYTSPNPYASLRWKTIEVHFYGSRKVVPRENSTMCFLMVGDVDAVNNDFTTVLKRHYGKIPRAGFPKITKVRNLVGDRRFTLTDPGGNTFFIGSRATDKDRFFRNLDDQIYAKRFAVLYDVLYSKEDPELAEKMLPQYTPIGERLTGLDKAKFLLLQLDIQKSSGRKMDDDFLKQVIQTQGNTSDWDRIRERYLEILNVEE